MPSNDRKITYLQYTKEATNIFTNPRQRLLAVTIGSVAACLTISADVTGQTPATDHSTYDNHGKIVDAKFLEDYDGRQGVLRFDQESSVVQCPDSDSLFFEGDMTIEMWVRLNGSFPPSSGMLFGEHNNFAFYLQYWNTLTFFYQTFNTELDAYDRMLVPIERHIISEKWSHIAVVAEFPRVRVYHNGELVRDAFMPFPGVLKRSRPIHKIGDNKTPIDLDEFRFYQRALTTAEVAAHAKGHEVSLPVEQELFVEPHWYDQTVAVRLSCKGTNYEGHRAEMVLLRGDQTQVVAPQSTTLEESFEGSGRYVATATFPLSDLVGMSLDGVARISGPDGTEAKTIYRHAVITKPYWVDSRQGYWDGVPPPWTPVQAQQDPNGAVSVNVWGRQHDFAVTPLLKQIETRDKQILAAPMTLTARADGQNIEWNDGHIELKQTSDTVAHLEQTFGHDRLELRIETSVEYDGYMLFDCTLRAKRQI